jgi:hypothetical protein
MGLFSIRADTGEGKWVHFPSILPCRPINTVELEVKMIPETAPGPFRWRGKVVAGERNGMRTRLFYIQFSYTLTARVCC